MLTLFGKNISELHHDELKRERRCHSYLLTRIRYMLKEAYSDAEEHDTQIQRDKVTFFEMYVTHLEALISECDYWLDRRFESESHGYHRRPRTQIRAENERRRKRQILDNAIAYQWQKTEDGLPVSWDRDKFFLIANDRGYQTEEIVISEVGRQLNLDRTRARIVLNNGRFTWGQVMVLGAFFQMTPREFCDTFLAGYFIEQFGEYRADYSNINKVELLKRAVKPKPQNPLENIEETYIEIGADGAPIDEEEWFD